MQNNSLNSLLRDKLQKITLELKEDNIFESDFDFNDLSFNLSEPNINNASEKTYEYATNIAFILKKYTKINVLQLAQLISDKLSKLTLNNQKLFQYVDIAAPGFINMSFTNVAYAYVLNNILESQEAYGSNQIIWDETIKPINVEYVSANPTGSLHVGHARGAAIGDTLIRIKRFYGEKVVAEYYVNDAGNQIENLVESAKVRYFELFNINLPMPQECYRGSDIINLAIEIKQKYNDYFMNDFDQKRWEFRNVCVDFLLNKIRQDLEEFGVVFDKFSSELAIKNSGQIEATLEKLKKYTYMSEGALFLKTSDFGDDKDRVLIKSDNTLTYFTPDIAYHLQKMQHSSKLINIWGADHSGYVARMSIALQCLGYPKQLLDVLIVQLVRLIKDGQEFKMSKRAGTSVTLADLLEASSKDAVRFMMVTRDANTKFDFDIDKSNSLDQNNPVFSVQYAHSRATSVLKKAGEFNYNYDEEFNLYPKMAKLILHLDSFSETIKAIVQTNKIQLMPTYLVTLSNLYNSFYSEHKIIGSKNEAALLSLTQATKNILKVGLELIGVSAPEQM
ncbi:arginine--tRNA ligase [Mycoplasmopsis ciconiae]|uniref:Arginine--tRNA ligase n=1 Tax=Mycoplasmopsis ciconiae TaxID=561067 RepID=A0ABU7MLW9_9BACT|nr:arginine--tRNA ligase [Mycoplasmopsis ciconiae]